MAGIYFHIPFCKQACHYCNFHFSTVLSKKDILTEKLFQELGNRKDYLAGETVHTIYFGGGTPSVLGADKIGELISKARELFPIGDQVEITLEGNPDDLTPSYLKALHEVGVNRLSIGIQSFFEEDLTWMNRAHTAEQSNVVIENALKAGFTSLSIDLIFGLPNGDDSERWAENLKRASEYPVDHMSCYGLTVEPKTVLHHNILKKYQAPLDPVKSEREFLMTRQHLMLSGFEHYEISNYARNKQYALHNTNYWNGVPYLGIGPSAHSFSPGSRQWNVANNAAYLKSFESDQKYFEKEDLDKNTIYNEYVMTSLRTMWGCNYKRIQEMGESFLTHFKEQMESIKSEVWLEPMENGVRLTEKGLLFADRAAMELFI